MPRFWRLKQRCARHSYVCRHGLYVVYIVTQTPRRSGDLDIIQCYVRLHVDSSSNSIKVHHSKLNIVVPAHACGNTLKVVIIMLICIGPHTVY